MPPITTVNSRSSISVNFDVPVTVSFPVIVNNVPSNVKLLSATAAFDVPSEVKTLLLDAFDIVENPVPDVPDVPLTPEVPDEPEFPDVPDEPEFPDVPDEPESP